MQFDNPIPESNPENVPQHEAPGPSPNLSNELSQHSFLERLYDVEKSIPGLRHPVELNTDERGRVSIKADSLLDSVRVQGYVHTTERFFQMDLTRRKMLGRLSEVFGENTLDSDIRSRKLGFAQVAKKIFEQLPTQQRQLVQEYTDGANIALQQMDAPAEYAALQLEPEKWQPQDCILNMLAMFDSLQAEHLTVKESLAKMKEVLPESVYRFLAPLGTRYDQPLIPTETLEKAMIPDQSDIDLRSLDSSALPKDIIQSVAATAGSNSWAISGDRSLHGGAIIANDPHLDLSLPNTWFMNEIEWQGHKLRGVSNPGTPGIIIGSNEKISWGFTNTAGDFQNYVHVEKSCDDEFYKTSEGDEQFQYRKESICIRGQEAPHEITVQETRWGPVMSEDKDGHPLALHWTALHPELVNFDHLKLNTATSVDAAIEVGSNWKGPSQNLVVADNEGNIGWVVTGFISKTSQSSPLPIDWKTADSLFEETDAPRPSIINPEGGILFTANQRTVDGDTLDTLGNFAALGIRASRIKELLAEKEVLTEKDLYNMQLDSEVAVLEPYRELVRQLSTSALRDKYLEQAASTVLSWDGTAEVESTGLTILEEFRSILHEELLGPLLIPVRDEHPDFVYLWNQIEEPVLQMLEERPTHLLTKNWKSLDELILHAFEKATRQVENGSWGVSNLTQIFHPLGAPGGPLEQLFPGVSEPMAGHPYAVRVARPGFGASMRMVVSPGLEKRGILQIAGGQSGNPSSGSYLSDIQDWLAGIPSEFTPQQVIRRTLITPDHQHEEKYKLLEREKPEHEDSSDIKENRLDDHILTGRHKGYITRSLSQTLRFFGLAGLLAEHQEAYEQPRKARELPEDLQKLYSIPHYEEIFLKGPKEVLGTLHYKGKLLIEGRERNFEFYLPKNNDSNSPFMLNLPITQGGYHLMSFISLRMARNGIAAGAIERRGAIFEESETPRRMEYEMRQILRDQRALLDWISKRPEIDSSQLGCVGVSLGGILGAVLTAVEPKINTSALVLAGADLPEIIRSSNLGLIKDWIKEYSEFKNLDCDEVEDRLHAYLQSDPKHFAQYINPSKVLLLNAKYDKVIPPKNADLLRDLLGGPKRILVPFGHYSALITTNYLIKQVMQFVKERAQD